MLFIFLVFLYSKDICICLVRQIGFNVAETCLSVTINEALKQCNLLLVQYFYQNCSIGSERDEL